MEILKLFVKSPCLTELNMYNYYNYSWTLCVKCWVSAFHTRIQIKFLYFADITERGDRGAKAEEIGGETEGDFMDSSNDWKNCALVKYDNIITSNYSRVETHDERIFLTYWHLINCVWPNVGIVQCYLDTNKFIVSSKEKLLWC